jgi:hypothetical protein
MGGAMPRRAADLQKMSLNLPRSTFDLLKRMAAERRTTMTEIIRAGIETERLLLENPAAREWLRRAAWDYPSSGMTLATGMETSGKATS